MEDRAAGGRLNAAFLDRRTENLRFLYPVVLALAVFVAPNESLQTSPFSAVKYLRTNFVLFLESCSYHKGSACAPPFSPLIGPFSPFLASDWPKILRSLIVTLPSRLLGEI